MEPKVWKTINVSGRASHVVVTTVMKRIGTERCQLRANRAPFQITPHFTEEMVGVSVLTTHIRDGTARVTARRGPPVTAQVRGIVAAGTRDETARVSARRLTTARVEESKHRTARVAWMKATDETARVAVSIMKRDSMDNGMINLVIIKRSSIGSV